MTVIYLGMPPPNVIEWFRTHPLDESPVEPEDSIGVLTTSISGKPTLSIDADQTEGLVLYYEDEDNNKLAGWDKIGTTN